MSLDQREKVFDDLKNNLKNVLEQAVTAKPSKESYTSTYGEYLLGLEKHGTLLAQSVNNTAMVYRSEPSPTADESHGLCKNVESRAVEYLNIFLSAPIGCGRYFLEDVRIVVVATLESCLSFVDELLKLHQSVRKKNRKKLVLPETSLVTIAEVWQKGQETIKNLPKNNYIACSKFILSQLRLISDAISELEEARTMISSDDIKEDIDDLEMDEFELDWSEEDIKLLGPATGLLKTVKNLVKKMGQTLKDIGASNIDNNIQSEINNSLDSLCDACAKLSPLSDDLASTLYPPIDPSEVNQAAISLIADCKCILDNKMLFLVLQTPVIAKSINISNQKLEIETPSVEGPNQNVKSWAEFLASALKHNETQLNLKLAERGITKLSV